MKTKKILSTIMAVLILLTQTAFAKDYSDYPQKFWDVSKDHWAYVYISELTDKNVISGYEDGSFKPEETVSRAEWSKMLVVASGKQPITLENNKSYAVDYNSNDWYYGYINSVISYMNFYNDDGNFYFKPNQSASREDVTVSLVKLKGYNVDNVDYSYISKFKDSNSVSNDLKKYIAVAIEKGLITGFEDNTFRGQDTLTRAEAATLLCRAFQLGNDNKTTKSNSVYLDGSDVNSNVSNETNKEESKNVSEGDLSDSKNSSGNTIINNNTVNNNTTINNNGNGNVNVNNGTINNNYSFDNSVKEDNSEDEEELEIEEEKKSHKIETLVKADIKNQNSTTGPINFVTMRDDDIYYLVDNTVYVVDTDGRGHGKVMNLDDGIYVGQDKYVIKTIYNLYYDENEDSILAYCYARKMNSITGTDEIAHIIVDVENKTLVTDKATNQILSNNILSVNEDGDYWTNKDGMIHLYSESKILGTKNTFSTEEMKSWDVGKIGYAFDMKENNNGTYFLTNGGIYKYNYSDFDLFLETNFNPIGMSDDGFVVRTVEGDFSFINFKGTVDDYVPTTEIEIKDKKSINSEFMNKMFINSKNEIIVYDLSNKCFRIISENK